MTAKNIPRPAPPPADVVTRAVEESVDEPELAAARRLEDALAAVRRALDDDGGTALVAPPGASRSLVELMHPRTATKAVVYVTSTEVFFQRVPLPGMPPAAVVTQHTGWFRLPLPTLRLTTTTKP